MLKDAKTFSSFSTNDIAKAKEFYGQTLDLEVSDVPGMSGLLNLNLAGGVQALIYQKDDHAPASHTVLNFLVDDVDAVVDQLTEAGVEFDKADRGPIKTDEKGIARGEAAGKGPDIAWFKDPAGNTLAVINDIQP